ncbi:MAG: hypothetical protein IKJ77_03695 [Firmicutes bacterium]|nr:hypothetical protein [Bacillota bacterium]
MLHSDWLKAHKKEIRILISINIILLVCLAVSSVSRSRYLVREDGNLVAIERDSLEQTLSLPLEVEAEKGGEKLTCEVILSIKAPELESDGKAASEDETVRDDFVLEDAVAGLIDEIETKKELRISLPEKLNDGTVLRWRGKRDLRFLLVFLLLPVCLLYIYETERKQEKERRRRYEAEIRKALPSFVDQLLLLLNCGMIFHDAFYRIEAGYATRGTQDSFCRLLGRIRKEADETGFMVITVMKGMAQEVGIREYVRMVNIMMDHQHRGVNLEEKLAAESRLLWEGRKASAMQRGKEMETKMTFPLALLLLVLIIIAGMPAMMNM